MIETIWSFYFNFTKQVHLRALILNQNHFLDLLKVKQFYCHTQFITYILQAPENVHFMQIIKCYFKFKENNLFQLRNFMSG